MHLNRLSSLEQVPKRIHHYQRCCNRVLCRSARFQLQRRELTRGTQYIRSHHLLMFLYNLVRKLCKTILPFQQYQCLKCCRQLHTRYTQRLLIHHSSMCLGDTWYTPRSPYLKSHFQQWIYHSDTLCTRYYLGYCSTLLDSGHSGLVQVDCSDPQYILYKHWSHLHHRH